MPRLFPKPNEVWVTRGGVYVAVKAVEDGDYPVYGTYRGFGNILMYNHWAKTGSYVYKSTEPHTMDLVDKVKLTRATTTGTVLICATLLNK